MRSWHKQICLFFMAVLFLSLAACSNTEEKNVDNIGTSNSNISLEVEQNHFPYKNWKKDNTHQKVVKGKLLVDEKPVVGAVIQISNKRTMTTDENGEYSILLDTNTIERSTVHVSSLDHTTVNGEALNEQTKEKIFALKQELVVYFPIEVDKVEENKQDASLVDVYAHAILKKDDTFPKFGVEKFPITGTVKDADGNPVEGATVNIRRDGVEGFSMSEPSNENGEYSLYYIPEDDESHYLNVYVPSKGITYTLPENKAFYFPDDYGIKLDIVLPKEGTVIQDKPPTLVATSTKGALYKGVLIGLNIPDDIKYSITVPQQDGTFIATLPKETWENNPSWYEINYRGFSENEISLGDTLTSGFIPLPKENEPSNIIATEK